MFCKHVQSQKCHLVTQIANKPEGMWFQVVCCCAGTSRVAVDVSMAELSWSLSGWYMETISPTRTTPIPQISKTPPETMVDVGNETTNHGTYYNIGTINHGAV